MAYSSVGIYKSFINYALFKYDLVSIIWKAGLTLYNSMMQSPSKASLVPVSELYAVYPLNNTLLMVSPTPPMLFVVYSW